MRTTAKWATEDNLQRVRELHAMGMGAKMISKQIGVSHGAIAGILNRLNISREEVEAPQVRDFYSGAVPAWLTNMSDKLFTILWDGGVKAADIQNFFGITMEQRRLTRERLKLKPRDPATSTKKRGRGTRLVKTRPVGEPDRPVMEETATVIKPFVHRPLGSANGGKTPVFTSSGINWSAVRAAKVERVSGICSWPLACGEATTGRFCAEHSGLLRRRAA